MTCKQTIFLQSAYKFQYLWIQTLLKLYRWKLLCLLFKYFQTCSSFPKYWRNHVISIGWRFAIQAKQKQMSLDRRLSLPWVHCLTTSNCHQLFFFEIWSQKRNITAFTFLVLCNMLTSGTLHLITWKLWNRCKIFLIILQRKLKALLA